MILKSTNLLLLVGENLCQIDFSVLFWRSRPSRHLQCVSFHIRRLWLSFCKGWPGRCRQLPEDDWAVVHVLDDLVHLLLGGWGRTQEDRRVSSWNRWQFSEQRLNIWLLCGAEDKVLDTLGREAETGLETKPEVWQFSRFVSRLKAVYSSSWEPITEPRDVTCHMGSHSVTCHPSQVNAPRLNSSQPGRYSIYLLRRDGRLSWPR